MTTGCRGPDDVGLVLPTWYHWKLTKLNDLLVMSQGWVAASWFNTHILGIDPSVLIHIYGSKQHSCYELQVCRMKILIFIGSFPSSLQIFCSFTLSVVDDLTENVFFAFQ